MPQAAQLMTEPLDRKSRMLSFPATVLAITLGSIATSRDKHDECTAVQQTNDGRSRLELESDDDCFSAAAIMSSLVAALQRVCWALTP